MSYKNIEIYYYSGTGNTFRAASWIKESAQEKNVILYPIEETKIEKRDTEGNDLVGIMFPTHAFTTPWSVIKFVLSLPKVKNKTAFVAATRGGGSFNSKDPGCEGTGTWLIALLLKMKGYKVVGIKGFDMPSNWTAVHGAYSDEKTALILERTEGKVKTFSEKILAGEKVYSGFLPLLIGLLFLPASLGYLFIGRMFLAKFFFANEKCSSCGLCEKICPVKAIRIKGTVKRRPYWGFKCESCMRCMGYCPEKAINYSQVFMVPSLYYFLMVPVGFLIIEKIPGIPEGNISWLLGTILYFVITFSFLYIVQLLLHYMGKNSFFNKLLCLTTFTSLYRRYHEPNTGASDLKSKSY